MKSILLLPNRLGRLLKRFLVWSWRQCCAGIYLAKQWALAIKRHHASHASMLRRRLKRKLIAAGHCRWYHVRYWHSPLIVCCRQVTTASRSPYAIYQTDNGLCLDILIDADAHSHLKIFHAIKRLGFRWPVRHLFYITEAPNERAVLPSLKTVGGKQCHVAVLLLDDVLVNAGQPAGFSCGSEENSLELLYQHCHVIRTQQLLSLERKPHCYQQGLWVSAVMQYCQQWQKAIKKQGFSVGTIWLNSLEQQANSQSLITARLKRCIEARKTAFHDRLKRRGLAAIAFSALMFLLLSTISFVRQSENLNRAEAWSLTASLDLKTALSVYSHANNNVLFKSPKVASAIESLLLETVFKKTLPLLKMALEKKLTLFSEQWPRAEHTDQEYANYFQTLRLYWMLYFPRPGDQQAFYRLLKPYLNKTAKAGRGLLWNVVLRQKGALAGFDQSLIKLARWQLGEPDNPRLLYALIKNDLNHYLCKQHLPSKLYLIFNSKPIPCLFSQYGFSHHINPAVQRLKPRLANTAWVLKQQAFNGRISDTLKQSLFNRYAHDANPAWLSWLSQLQLSRTSQTSDLVEQLAHLSRWHNSMVQLGFWVSNQTHLLRERHWFWWNRYLEPLADNFSVLKTMWFHQSFHDYLKQLDTLKQCIQRLAWHPEETTTVIKEVMMHAHQNALIAAVDSAQIVVERIENPALKHAVLAVLLAPVRSSWAWVFKQGAQQVTPVWQQTVLQRYALQLSPYFPFNPQGEDVDMGSVSQFFSRSGVLWPFVKKQLAPFVIKQAGVWQARRWLGVSATLPKGMLGFLNHAEQLSQTVNAAQQLQLNFSLYPEPTPGVNETVLQLGSQQLLYQNGPQHWQQCHWPDSEATLGSELSIALSNGQHASLFSQHHALTLLHLLKHATLTRLDSHCYRLSFPFPQVGKTVRFLMKGGEGLNALLWASWGEYG